MAATIEYPSPTSCPFCRSDKIEFEFNENATVVNRGDEDDEQDAAYFQCGDCSQGFLVWQPMFPQGVED